MSGTNDALALSEDLHAQGNRYRDIGRIDDAIPAYREAIQLAPGNIAAHRDFLLAIQFSLQWSSEQRFAEHKRFWSVHAPGIVQSGGHINPPDRQKRLRIGYLSCHFSNHPVGRNLAPVIHERNHDEFEAVCFCEGTPDAFGRSLLTAADVWHQTGDKSDTEIATLITRENIDILVVVAGHLDRSRLLAAASKPAPVQISYHDAATSGLDGMDYLFTDRHLSPRHGSELFTERLLRLPSLVYMAPPANAPPLVCAPRHAVAPVFGCFNAPAKLADAAVACWTKILMAVPQARLLLRHRNSFLERDCRDRLLGIMTAGGVTPDRIEFRGEPEDHPLTIYGEIDATLDPFPFSGSTSSFESLFMGVPVVTQVGACMTGRWSTAILASLGLNAWIADSEAEYVAIASRLGAAGVQDNAARLRLHRQVVASPLCDSGRKVAQIERMYRAVWARWCKERLEI